MIAGLVVALGFVALALVPIGGLLLVWASIGMPGLTALLVVNGAVMLARSVSPLRAAAWFKKPQADEPGLPMRVLTMETVLTAAAVVLLAATAGWWQPLLGVSVPLWIVVLLAVRASALAMMGALSTLKRPIAAVVLLADIAVVLPLAAVLTRSFTGTVIASTAASCAFAALALHAGTITRLEKKVGKKLDMAEVPEAELRDRWRLGTWLQTMQSNLRRPLIVAMGGAMLAVPLSAAVTVSSVLMLPFVTAAATKPSRSLVLRVLRGVACAGAGIWFVHACGPEIYRAVFPDVFGDGAWVQVLAWCNLAALPIGIRGDSKKASQLRIGVAAALAAAALVGLGVSYGVTGALWGIVASSAIGSLIGMTVEKSDPLAWD